MHGLACRRARSQGKGGGGRWRRWRGRSGGNEAGEMSHGWRPCAGGQWVAEAMAVVVVVTLHDARLADLEAPRRCLTFIVG